MGNPNLNEVSKATQFKPGNPGGGKPKGSIHIKTLAKRLFDDPDTWNRLPVDKDKAKALKEMVGSDKTFGEALLYAWLSKSMTDPRFASIVLELTDGKGKVEHALEDGFFMKTKLQIEIVEPVNTDNEDTIKPETETST